MRERESVREKKREISAQDSTNRKGRKEEDRKKRMEGKKRKKNQWQKVLRNASLSSLRDAWSLYIPKQNKMKQK